MIGDRADLDGVALQKKGPGGHQGKREDRSRSRSGASARSPESQLRAPRRCRGRVRESDVRVASCRPPGSGKIGSPRPGAQTTPSPISLQVAGADESISAGEMTRPSCQAEPTVVSRMLPSYPPAAAMQGTFDCY